MGYECLEKSLIDLVKEEQAKLGYRKEMIRLYYPLSSLNHFMEADADPEEMQELIREKKETEFQIAYQKGTELFLAKGYGRQMSGGYSIQVKELSASSNAVFFETKLIGPTEKIQGGEPSYPYIVIKTEYRDGPVQFQ